MTDNDHFNPDRPPEEPFDPVGPDIPGGEVKMEPPQEELPKFMIVFTFESEGSGRFHYQRTEGITPYQMLAVSGHLKVEAELMIQTWIIEQQMRTASPPSQLTVPPKRGVRGIFDRGRWKPPLDRRG